MKSPKKRVKPPRPDQKQLILTGARKAQTSLMKVIDKLEQDHYCVDVLQQALAVQGLWKSVIRRIFAEHLETCFRDALEKGDEQKRAQVIKEVIRVMELAERS